MTGKDNDVFLLPYPSVPVEYMHLSFTFIAGIACHPEFISGSAVCLFLANGTEELTAFCRLPLSYSSITVGYAPFSVGSYLNS
ncbi:MAG: hypothetical protein LBO62_00235, partial [Endomicrobium sp.]|nr:hypothetical protein [Endomicrobium sp.]